jgi:hypothetical protein
METVKEIAKKLKVKYLVDVECNLPVKKRGEAIYQPDIVAFNKQNGEVMYIIEVQTANVRKSIAGATILAEVCMSMLNQPTKPSLFFVVKDKSGGRELMKLNFRVRKIMESLKKSHLKEAKLLKKTDFLKCLDQL